MRFHEALYPAYWNKEAIQMFVPIAFEPAL